MNHRAPPIPGALAACALYIASMHADAQAAASSEPQQVRVPARLFAGEPRGPYETGTFEELWVNEALDDPSTAASGDKRKVIVQIWYPAGPAPRSRLAPYAISPQLYGSAHWVHSLGHVRTQSKLDAPVVAGDVPLPVLIYNHGNGYPHFSGTFQTEFLASHGYVVVAIGHPGANGIERFPDGTSYVNDAEQWLAQAPASARLSPREAFEYQAAHSQLGLYVQDLGFVLDRLTRLNAERGHRFHRRLDLERVGSLGWSLGGFISLQAARDEPRIKAAANLDGWPLGLLGPRGVVTLGSERPVLLMFNGYVEPNAEGNGLADVAYTETWFAAYTYFWSLLRRSTADWYYVTVARTNHGHFSDHPLFEAQDPQRWLHPRAAHAIVNAYTLEFFDKYVRGDRAETPLLSATRAFAEATLIRRKPARAVGEK